MGNFVCVDLLEVKVRGILMDKKYLTFVTKNLMLGLNVTACNQHHVLTFSFVSIDEFFSYF